MAKKSSAIAKAYELLDLAAQQLSKVIQEHDELLSFKETWNPLIAQFEKMTNPLTAEPAKKERKKKGTNKNDTDAAEQQEPKQNNSSITQNQD